MTVPRLVSQATESVREMVARLMPTARGALTEDERKVAVYLRGNENLYSGLRQIIESRIEGRALMPLPADPLECMRRMAADKELRLLLGQVDRIYRSPLVDEVGERPA